MEDEICGNCKKLQEEIYRLREELGETYQSAFYYRDRYYEMKLELEDSEFND